MVIGYGLNVVVPNYVDCLMFLTALVYMVQPTILCRLFDVFDCTYLHGSTHDIM